MNDKEAPKCNIPLANNKNMGLTRVGVTHVKKPINVRRPNRVVTLNAEFDIFVDLPGDERSSHLSRNLEVINEIVDDSVRNPIGSVEELVGLISTELLTRHGYASHAEILLSSDYFVEKVSPKGRKSLENYKLMAKATADKKNGQVNVRRMVGVEVVGMTACPCAMETIKGLVSDYENIESPTITHNQRNRTILMVDCSGGCEIEADDLIELVEGSLSSPTFEILKREDEAAVTMAAHQNPRFVEDVVREILRKIIERYGDLPDDAIISVRSESEESIHKHNALAERITTMGELRKA